MKHGYSPGLVGATSIVLLDLVMKLWGSVGLLPFAKSTSLAYRGTAHPDIITGLVFSIVNEVHALGALGNEVLRYCVNNTGQTINIFPRDGEVLPTLSLLFGLQSSILLVGRRL
jgi:hypothetical protein